MNLAARLGLIGALVVGILMPADAAGAGTYTVHTCKAPDGALAVPAWAIESRHGAYFVGNACPGGYFWMDLLSGVEHKSDEYVLAKFVAPADTEITDYALWRSVQLSTRYRYDFFEIPKRGGIDVKESCFGDFGCRELGTSTVPSESANLLRATGRSGVAGLAFNLYCSNVFGSGAPCPPGTPSASFQIHRAQIGLSDAFPPVLALPPAGPLVSSATPLTGEQQVWIWATDRGGGVRDVLFEVDGKVAARSTIDENDGRCREPFAAPQPCRLDARGTASLDTATLPDGSHRLRLLVTDATGTNATAWGPITVRTANRTCNPHPRSDALRVRAAFSGRGGAKKVRVAQYRERLRVRGQVTRPDGSPAAGAPVCLVTRNDSPAAALRAVRTVVTDVNGRFAHRIPRGPSRRLYFVVRVAGGAASASLGVRVRAPVRLRLSRRELSNGQA